MAAGWLTALAWTVAVAQGAPAPALAEVAVSALPGGRGPCGVALAAWLVRSGRPAAPAGAAELWDWAVASGAVRDDPWPEVGDLAFLRGGAGEVAHVAVVLAMRSDGTAVLAHPHDGDGLLHVNAFHPTVAELEGERLNDRFGEQLAAARLVAWVAPPPASLDSGALGRVLVGDPLRPSDLAGAACQELWFLRNAVAARHGYRFGRSDVRTAFDGQPWYLPRAGLDRAELRRLLTAEDRRSLSALAEREQASGCR
jgi:hypothetical protein